MEKENVKKIADQCAICPIITEKLIPFKINGKKVKICHHCYKRLTGK